MQVLNSLLEQETKAAADAAADNDDVELKFVTEDALEEPLRNKANNSKTKSPAGFDNAE